jgi:uncharacterized protein YodC (DUF2158 family)
MKLLKGTMPAQADNVLTETLLHGYVNDTLSSEEICELRGRVSPERWDEAVRMRRERASRPSVDAAKLQFPRGTIVTLTGSNVPRMAVTTISDDGMVATIWFDTQNTVQRAEFHSDLLEIVGEAALVGDETGG